MDLASADVTGLLGLTNGGTGASTQAGAANAILPSQTGNSGKFLTTDGSDVSWATTGGGGGGVTSVIAGPGISVSSGTGDVTISATAGVAEGAKVLVANQAGFSGGPAPILYSAPDVEYDTSTFTGSSEFTVNASTLYTVQVSGNSTFASSTDFLLFYYQVNAGPVTQFSSLGMSNALVNPSAVGVVDLNLTAGDTVKVYAFSSQDTVSSVIMSIARHGGSGVGSSFDPSSITTSLLSSGDLAINLGSDDHRWDHLFVQNIFNDNGQLNFYANTSVAIYAETELDLNNTGGADINMNAAGTIGIVAGAGGVVEVAATTGISDIQVRNDNQVSITGHFLAAAPGGAPTFGSCGTDPVISGNDISGLITVGTGGIATSCSIVFQIAYSDHAPHCFINNQTDIVALQVVPSTTGFSVNSTAPFTAGAVLDYFCIKSQ